MISFTKKIIHLYIPPPLCKKCFNDCLKLTNFPEENFIQVLLWGLDYLNYLTKIIGPGNIFYNRLNFEKNMKKR